MLEMCQYLQDHSATNKTKRPQHKHWQLLFHYSSNPKTLYCRANHKLFTSYNIRQQVHAENNISFFHTLLLRVNLSKFEYNEHAEIQTLKIHTNVYACTVCVFNPSINCAYTTHVSTQPLTSVGRQGTQKIRCTVKQAKEASPKVAHYGKHSSE